MIRFHNTDHPYRHPQKIKTRTWLQDVIVGYGKVVGEVDIVFCSDDYLLKINKEALDHHDLTDIITFDYCVGDIVSGDLFISVNRVRENAKIYNVKPLHEMSRVMVHGVLHLIGFGDKELAMQKAMREAENRALAKLFHVKP